jgi:hypothetical protein
MTVRDLIAKLQKLDRPDLDVCVKVTNCLSANTGEPVKDLYCGFDWEQGKLMLYTGEQLIRMRPTCRRCGMYGVKAAERITSRVMYTNMGTGDMEVIVYLDGKKKFSVPFNVRNREAR